VISKRPARRHHASVRLRTLLGLAAAGLALSGCGSSIGIHPGSAAVIGAESVSMDKIDSTSTLYCKAYVASQQQQSAQQQSGPVPMGLFRSYVAGSLAKRLLGEQLADQYAVQPASGYQSQVSQLTSALASAPSDERQAVIDVAAADAYLQNVQVAVGQKLTGNEGQSNADIKAALQRGQVATQDWLNDHDAVIDPVFALSVDGGKFTRRQDQTSYALSTFAAEGVKQQPDQSYSAALPAAQRCG
jgi:hypothetical protein